MAYLWDQEGALPWEMMFPSHVTPRCHLFACALCTSARVPQLQSKNPNGASGAVLRMELLQNRTNSLHTQAMFYMHPLLPSPNCNWENIPVGWLLPLQLLGTHEESHAFAGLPQDGIQDKDSFKGICNTLSEGPAEQAMETMRALIVKFSSAVLIKEQALVSLSFPEATGRYLQMLWVGKKPKTSWPSVWLSWQKPCHQIFKVHWMPRKLI